MADHRLQIVLAAKDITGNAFNKLKTRLSGLASSMFSLRGAAVALGGIAGVGYLVKSSLEAADVIGKTADAVGLSTDALQEYHHAAELAGVGTKKVNSVFLAFSKRVGELRQGTGPLVTYLNKFDKTLLQNIRSAHSTEQALNLVFKRMGETTSATDRAALANAAFSRSGIVLTGMVKDGAEGLAKMRKEAQDLGIVLSEDMIRDSEAANDALQKLTSTLSTSFSKTIAANIDTLTAALDGLTKAMIWLGKQASTSRRIEELAKIGALTKGQLAAFQRHASLGPKLLAEGEAKLKSYGAADESYHEKFKLGDRPPTNAPLQEGIGAKILKDNTKVITPLTDMWATFYDNQTQLAAKASIKKAKVLQSYELPANEKSVMALTDMWATFNDEQTRTASAASIAKAEAIEDFTSEAAGSAGSIQQSFADAFDNASNALTDFLMDGKSSFKDFTNSILNDIARMGMQKVFSTGFETLFAGIMHSGGAAGAAGSARAVPASMFIGAPRLHKGLAPDEFPVIIERGETVLPKGAKRGSRGSNVEVFVNNYSGQPATVRESQGPGGMRQIFVMIGNDIKNGGPTAQAFEQTYNMRRAGRTL